MRVLINKASQKQIDWLVAKCTGELESTGCSDVSNFLLVYERLGSFHFSDDWLRGGPIVSQLIMEGMWLQSIPSVPVKCLATMDGFVIQYTGSTPLLAAMRCYVGQFYTTGEAEVPDELQ